MAPEGDFRKLPPATQVALRHVAVAMVAAGKTRTQAAAAVGVNRRFVGKWVKAVVHSGDGALIGRRRGRRPGEQRALTVDQERRLLSLIAGQHPDQLHLRFALWTRRAAQALIERETGVLLALPVVGRYLRRWGFSGDGLIRRATERREAPARSGITRRTILASPLIVYLPLNSDETLEDAATIELMWRLSPEPRRAEQALQHIDEIGKRLKLVASKMKMLLEARRISVLDDCWLTGLALMGVGDTLWKKHGTANRANHWYQTAATQIFEPLSRTTTQRTEQTRDKIAFERVVNLNHLGLSDLLFEDYTHAMCVFRRARQIAKHWVNRLKYRRDCMGGSLAEDGRRTVLEAALNSSLHLVDWEREAYLSELRMGEIYMLHQNIFEADRCFERAMSVATEAVDHTSSTTVNHDIATILERRGDLRRRFATEGRFKFIEGERWPNFDRALQFFQQSRDIRLALADDLAESIADKTHHWQYDLAVNFEKIGDSYHKLNRRDDKLVTYKESKAIADNLLIECPASSTYSSLVSRLDKKMNQKSAPEPKFIMARIVYQ
jgi:transposase/tetratricopeptide (TPR) repeat protein